MTRLIWRPVGDGPTWPSWLRALRHAYGAYAIRRNGRVLYVGESHKGRLYDTITRHFQGWSRAKLWWRGFLGPATDPGRVYDRRGSEVAVLRVASAAAAVRLQAHLIGRLDPEDNHKPTATVPF